MQKLATREGLLSRAAGPRGMVPHVSARSPKAGEWSKEMPATLLHLAEGIALAVEGGNGRGRVSRDGTLPQETIGALLSALPGAVVVADERGICECNQAALALLGAGEARALRRRKRLFTSKQRPRVVWPLEPNAVQDDPLWRALLGETCVCDVSIVSGNRRARSVIRCAAAPVKRGQRVVGAALVATAITDRKKHEAALKKARDQLGMRSRKRAAALATANERLKVEIIDRLQIEEELRVVNDTLENRIGTRTADLLHYQRQLRSLDAELNLTEQRERNRLARELHDNLAQMLALCKIKAGLLHRALGRRKLAGEAAALKDYLDEALRFTRTMMSDLSPALLHQGDLLASMHWLAEKMRAHGLEVKIQDDGISKNIDESVRVVLFESVRELLFNVIKHAGTARAEVTLRKYQNFIRVAVRDHGIGFDHQSERPAPTSAGGFGLFNMRERLDLLGGRVEIRSVRNGGSIVILLAPLGSSAPTKPGRSVETEAFGNAVSGVPAPAARRIRVALADDRHMIRDRIRSVVKRQPDLEIVGEAANEEEAVEICRVARPDVIVMDVNTPSVDGRAATTQIRKEFPETSVIGLSVHTGADARDAMRSAGAAAYLRKDDAAEALCAAIRRVVGRSTPNFASPR